MASYTEKMEDSVFQWGDLDDFAGDYCDLIEAINDENFFRTFGEGLLFFIQRRNPWVSAENAHKYIDECCQNTGVPKSDIVRRDVTLKGWLKGEKRPKKGENSRSSMFALAFALQLTPEETAELFHKVYLDRAFDFRNVHEIVYYFCLNNRKTWEDAKRLISILDSTPYTVTDHTISRTIYIGSKIHPITDEEKLVEYVTSLGHNLDKKNVKSKTTRDDLISIAQKIAEKETKLIARRKWAESVGTKQDELEDDHSILNQYRDCNALSRSHLYEVITGQFVHNKEWSGTRTVFSNACLPNEIRRRFPEAGSFSKKDPTYEELRKVIVLLASYCHWYCVEHPKEYPEAENADFDTYLDWINSYLDDCGFSPMYCGNPYDWLFMYCTLAQSPLNRFRGILAEVLEE